MGDQIIHASCVAVYGKAVLIVGKSGSGKSSLALHLMAYGAEVVADDRTHLTAVGCQIIAKAPTAISGLIEARGVGILNANADAQAEVVCVVDMDEVEQDRIPVMRHQLLLGCEIPVLHKCDSPTFPAALLQYLKGGRQDTI